MDREIKFRAWNKNRKEYELLDSLFEMQKMNLAGYEYNERIFEQYTGLKDKNGVEIYEGDIYKNSWNTYSVVECFSDDGWQTTGHNTGDRFISIGLRMKAVPKEIEIAGNIHENKDLLDE